MIERATAGCSKPLPKEEIGTKYEDTSFFPFDILGYSLGGGAAMQCAIRHPNRAQSRGWLFCPTQHTSR